MSIIGFYRQATTQGIGKADLQSVTKLINQEWKEQRRYHGRNLHAIRKPAPRPDCATETRYSEAPPPLPR